MYNRSMPTRRELLNAMVGVGATLVVGGCASGRSGSPAGTTSPVTTSPVTTSPVTTSPVTTSPVTTSPVTTSPVTTSPVTTSPVTTSPIVPVPWSGADFDELDQFLDAANTEAFRIVEGGQVIHEWYRTDENYGRDIASAQKSVLSLLVGRAIDDGLVTLDTPIDEVLGPDWTPHGQSATITVRQLLSMTSGLDDQYEVIAAPGTEWHYSGAFAALFTVLTTLTGRQLGDIADDWLFSPAGAPTARFYERRSNQFAPIGLFARASDLTAIGQAVLDVDRAPVTSAWLDESFSPSSTTNESYGYLWWLNGQASYRLPGARVPRPGPLIPSAPADLVAALGKDDQKLYVSRELDLAVARLGAKASPEVRAALSTFDDPLWERLVALRSS
jgi:CubicO group peptidase (beta-lactamase class C family)